MIETAAANELRFAETTLAELIALQADTLTGALLKFGAECYYTDDPWGEAVTLHDACVGSALEDLRRSRAVERSPELVPYSKTAAIIL